MKDTTQHRFREFLKNNNLRYAELFDDSTVAIYTELGKYICLVYEYQVTHWDKQHERKVNEMLLKRLFL
jgi:hypothetical protein